MQKTKFKKLEKPKGGPLEKSEKNQKGDPWKNPKKSKGTLGKSKNFRNQKIFFVKNISFNPKNAFPHPIVGLFAENSLRKSIWVSLGRSIRGPQTEILLGFSLRTTNGTAPKFPSLFPAGYFLLISPREDSVFNHFYPKLHILYLYNLYMQIQLQFTLSAEQDSSPRETVIAYSRTEL